ncbi:hypothetical protein PVK06_010194 [Gossypium arboreum]|uniref:Uncharacterized protein n=1 Tax=Gossypium arboreum TaxID=29729 RepID=A0ABR0QPL2_GOSAR|nr:hypothetical protein PVK06_010194 [Gossypium arboreum]
MLSIAKRTTSCFVSSSDDGTAKLWDMHQRGAIQTFPDKSDASDKIFTGGIDSKGENRCEQILEGHQHNFEKNLLKCGWSPDGSKVTAGSSDRMVYIWDTTSRRILFKLPGHTGSVNETIFHPNEPIVGSCSSDKQI